MAEQKSFMIIHDGVGPEEHWPLPEEVPDFFKTGPGCSTSPSRFTGYSFVKTFLSKMTCSGSSFVVYSDAAVSRRQASGLERHIRHPADNPRAPAALPIHPPAPPI